MHQDLTSDYKRNINQNSKRNKQQQLHRRSRGARDMKICFNVGRELFVYNYDGVRAGPDESNLIYKRFYKGSSPTAMILIKQLPHLVIDKTQVTYLKWLPNSPGLFSAANASGQMCLYKDDLAYGTTAPIYQIYKQSGGLVVYTCKTKATRNGRWARSEIQLPGFI
jgi:hypothetical protein